MINSSDVVVYEVVFRFPGESLPTCYRTTHYGNAIKFIRMLLSNEYILESFIDIGFTEEGFNEFKEVFEP